MVKKTLMFLTSIIFIIAFLNFSSAIYLWENYGNAGNPFKQAQNESAYSLFNGTALSYSQTAGYKIISTKANMKFQPLISELGDSSASYIILPNNNYLQIYDKDLSILLEQISTGNITNQIAINDFNGDGVTSEISGVYLYNTTIATFKTYDFNYSDSSLTQIYEYNFTISTDSIIGGLRSNKNSIYFLIGDYNGTTYIMDFVDLNSSAVSRKNIFNSTLFLNEPLSWEDYDNDGVMEFITHSTYNMIIFNENGVIEHNKNSGNGVMYDSYFLNTDGTSIDKFMTLFSVGGVHTGCYDRTFLWIYNSDGSHHFNVSINCASMSADSVLGKSAIGDYDNDGYDDVYVVSSRYPYNDEMRFIIYDAGNTSQLYNTIYSSPQNLSEGNSLTLSDMNGNGITDFILYTTDKKNLRIYEPLNANTTSYLLNVNPFSDVYSCIPADIRHEGILSILCSGTDYSILYYSSALNNNAEINSVIFNPSTTIDNNTLLSVTINASDTESDTIYYKVKCSDSASWSSANGQLTDTYSCSYSTAGTYNLTSAVRDEFHVVYDYFSQDIIVTEEGVVPEEVTAEGGMTLPTELVSTENYEQGLLPEIYFGMLAFFSNTLHPFIVLIIVIFIVMIIFTIGSIISKLMEKLE